MILGESWKLWKTIGKQWGDNLELDLENIWGTTGKHPGGNWGTTCGIAGRQHLGTTCGKQSQNKWGDRQLGDKVPRFPQLRDLTETLRMHLEKTTGYRPELQKTGARWKTEFDTLGDKVGETVKTTVHTRWKTKWETRLGR